MDNSEPDTLTEKDIIEVAKRKDSANHPIRANGKFRDLPNSADALADAQRLWLHHPAFPLPPQRRTRAQPQEGRALSVRRDVAHVLSGYAACHVGRFTDTEKRRPEALGPQAARRNAPQPKLGA